MLLRKYKYTNSLSIQLGYKSALLCKLLIQYFNAGLRIDPESFSRSRMSYYTDIEYTAFTEDLMLPIKDGRSHKIQGVQGLMLAMDSIFILVATFSFSICAIQFFSLATGIPSGYWINYITWSPKGTYIAFTLRSAGGDSDPPREPLQLWVADLASGQARKLLDSPLNVVFDE